MGKRLCRLRVRPVAILVVNKMEHSFTSQRTVGASFSGNCRSCLLLTSLSSVLIFFLVSKSCLHMGKISTFSLISVANGISQCLVFVF